MVRREPRLTAPGDRPKEITERVVVDSHQTHCLDEHVTWGCYRRNALLRFPSDVWPLISDGYQREQEDGPAGFYHDPSQSKVVDTAPLNEIAIQTDPYKGLIEKSVHTDRIKTRKKQSVAATKAQPTVSTVSSCRLGGAMKNGNRSSTHQWSSLETRIATFCFLLRYVMDHSILYRPASWKMSLVRSRTAHPNIHNPPVRQIGRTIRAKNPSPSVHRFAHVSIAVWSIQTWSGCVIHPIGPFTPSSINEPVQPNHRLQSKQCFSMGGGGLSTAK